MNFDPYLGAYTKINLRWITELKVKVKSMKLIKENVEYLHDPRAGKDFLGCRKH